MATSYSTSSILPKSFKFPSIISNSNSSASMSTAENSEEICVISIYEDFNAKNIPEEDNKLGIVCFDKKRNIVKISGKFIKVPKDDEVSIQHTVFQEKKKLPHLEISDPCNNACLYEFFGSIIQWSLIEHRADSVIFEARMNNVPFPIGPIAIFENVVSGRNIQDQMERHIETIWNIKMC